MSRDEKLAQIAANDTESYITRKQALDDIHDKHLIDFLAENAKDEWIRLESAIQSKNKRILGELARHKNESIRLEASIELGNQEALAEIVINANDDLSREIAFNYITDKEQLRQIAEKSPREQDRVEAAIRLGDHELCKLLIEELTDSNLLFRMARFINDYKLIEEISGKVSDTRLKKITGEWLEDLKPGSKNEID